MAERLYEPFFTTKDVGEGTGLDLSIVHDNAMHHGGATAVQSQLGQGTTFALYLPHLDAGSTEDHEPERVALPHGKGACCL